MAGFQVFPGGAPGGVEGKSLAFAVLNEGALRATYRRAVAEIAAVRQHPPAHWTTCQRELAVQQAHEDAQTIYYQLKHAERRLDWEKQKRWRK